MSSTHEVMNQLPTHISQTFGDFTLFENADSGHDDAAIGSSFPTSWVARGSDEGRTTVQCLSESELLPTLDVEGSSPETAHVPWEGGEWEITESPLIQADFEKDGRSSFRFIGEQEGYVDVVGQLFGEGNKVLTGGIFDIINKDAASENEQQINDLCAQYFNCEDAGAPLSESMDGLSASVPDTEMVHTDNLFTNLQQIAADPNLTQTEALTTPAPSDDIDEFWSELAGTSTTSPIPALLSPESTTDTINTDDILSPLFSPLVSPMNLDPSLHSTPSSPASPIIIVLTPEEVKEMDLNVEDCEEMTLHVTKIKDERVEEIDKITKARDGMFYCPDCKQAFDRRFNLKTHFAAKHANVRNYGCGVCDRSFARKYDMVRHMKTRHDKIGHVVVNGGVSKPRERLRIAPAIAKAIRKGRVVLPSASP
ncbi:hypothetical protein HDV00_000682 [Rhizophlyctis rosea]|nr:hypothetical protein HDV00_000682 [Rhizophlyctis rosea]